MDINSHTKILVVGLGYRSGLAAANFLAKRGCAVHISDSKNADELRGTIERLDPRVVVHAGEQNPELLNVGFDIAVLSPGVPQRIPLIVEAKRRGIPVIAEIELAYRFMKGRIAAITGTDGKSTTTALVGHILNDLGITALVGGNIGIPLISLVEQTRDDTVSVVELSSFQLETVDAFRPDAAAILNVTPDHLDRYDGMREYFEAKLRIAKNQTDDDFFIYNMDDATLAGGIDGVRAKKLSFSLADNGADIFYKDGFVYRNGGSRAEMVLDASTMRILGLHNVQNAMTSILMVTSILTKMGRAVQYERIAAACCSFQGLEHRMERLGEIDGRTVINDSKATTVGAVEMALRSIAGKCVLILGGRTKGDDYSRLRRSMTGKVKGLVLIGESTDEFSRIFGDCTHTRAGSMDDALVKAMSLSAPGDTVILSPACASFDMFKSFEERGEVFRESFLKMRRGDLPWT